MTINTNAPMAAMTAQPTDPTQQLQQTAQPNQPTQPVQPTQTQPTQPPIQQTQPPIPKVSPTTQSQQGTPSLHARIFDKILKGMTGGPQRIVDENGNVQEVPQSRATMGKSIVAAALAGLMSPSHYRDTPYGPVRDYSADMAGAAQAGQAAYAKPQQKAQEQSNLQQTRKLFTLQNNVKLVQQAAAMAHQKHEVLDDVVKTNTEKFANPLAEWDKQRPAGEDSIFANKGMTSDEVLKSGHNLTDHNVYIDGYVEKPDQFGVLEPQPTYAIIRTTNKDGSPISLKLPQEVTDELGKFNKGYQQAYTATGGNVIVPINNYMDAVHTYHTLNSVESFMNRVQKDVNPKGSKIDLAAAYKKDPAGMWNAIQQAENALAAGNGRAGEETEDAVLSRVANTPGGSQLLNLVGTPQQVEDWKNSLVSKRALAKEGGMGDKAPAPPGMVGSQVDLVKNSDLPPDVKNNLLDGVPEMSGGKSNMKEAEQFRDRVATAIQTSTRNKIQQGDPAMIAAQTTNTIGAGDLTSAKQIISSRGTAREAWNTALESKAEELGLNPQHFNVGALERKQKAADDYSASGKIGQQLATFKKFSEHVSDAKDANDAWQRTGSPLLNKPLRWWAENAANDQNYKRFQASVIAPAKEYMNFLNQNRAEHETDIDALEPLLDPKATPESAYTALQTFMKTADDQAFAMGEQYRDTVGTTFPGLVSKSTADAMRKLGVTPRATALSGTLPRAQSWVTNLQPQKLTAADPNAKAIVTRFVQAAGSDPEKAMEMGREHGYIFNLTK